MATKRATRQKDSQLLQLVSNNNDAAINGAQRKKTFSIQDIYRVDPLTDNQAKAFELFDDTPDTGLCLSGCAGTGKTFLAINMALKLVLDKDTPFKKIIIIRSTAQSRDIGFLKGTEEEKIQVFKKPYVKIFDELFKYKKSFENMEEAGFLEFESTSFLRGTTMNESIVVFDEFQNCTYAEAITVLQRLGRDSKIIVSGDFYQSDLKKETEKEGTLDFIEVMKHMNSMDTVEFQVEDIVRSGFCKDLILTQIKLGHM